ncbi:Fe-S protein assembly chaperone HscA [Entomomonas sp. E2T0]|uniref:Fe-S protein assembly chaperone HscA n=1 Tax=Entomomonas sp. E2T0 TaxID=2930213 RepID=UPI00222843E7|nr:Fe-S protein assembly chaperone HscA [Entomomonas sp. E2T0]UYZ82611.1 Fe-S protein assembly chaperone HscA [Entomomonas sp. E2T0]
MSLLQIAEPGQSPKPHQKKLAVGIDLGTTNSLVASVLSGIPKALTDLENNVILPSVVHYLPDQIEVGKTAKAGTTQDPLNTISSVKRLMGRGISDVKQLGEQLPYRFTQGESNMPFIETVQGPKSPVEISAEILKALKERAEQSLGGSLVGAVITVPAYFDDGQRQATKDAARLAGLTVLRLLNEPTAAAVAYGLDKQAEGIIAIYDLGGGTFDISILRLAKGVFEVLSTGGDSSLGGDDFDHLIADWIITEANLSNDLSPSEQKTLLKIACAAKESLTDNQQTTISYKNWQSNLTREQFNNLITPLVERTLKACRRAVRDTDIDLDEITNVVMVGGSTRVPLVRQQVGELFGSQPLTDIDPDQVVALGAAVQADALVGNRSDDDQLLLLDVIPLSLGLETMGGLMEKVIPRNTTIPVARAQDFTTYKDGQTAMMIHVLQGERELVADCRSLARFELRGFPPMVAGAAKIRVTFQVDADGLLAVSAQELTSGAHAAIQVKPSYGLTDGEIARMLQDSFAYAENDKQQRSLREAQVEANQLVEITEAALQADGKELLNQTEYQEITKHVAELKKVVNSNDLLTIEKYTQKLSTATDSFAAKRMNATVKQALTGRRLNEIDSE